VGKGSGNRAYHNGKGQRCVPVPKDLLRILVQEFPSEQYAFEAEKFFISYYGRKDLGTGCLRNRTEGGEGSVGAIRSEEFRARVSKQMRGNTYCLGTKQSLETRQKRAEKLRGRKRPANVCKRIADAQKGRKNSDETRQKISETLMKQSPEIRQQRARNARAKSPGNTGNKGGTPWNKGLKIPGHPSPFKGKKRPPFSDEHRKHLSDAAKARYAVKEGI
jgi:hypothetical protein